MSNGGANPYSFFAQEASLIAKKHQEHSKLKAVHQEIADKKQAFFKPFGNNLHRLTWLGVLCFAALLFDFLINSRTMGWMPSVLYHAPVSIYAIVFTIFDAIIASMQAGVFLTADPEFIKMSILEQNQAFKKAKKTWRPILWGLASIKIVLFIIYTYINSIKVSGSSDISTTLILIIVMVVFVIMIYLILDQAGEGIFIVFNKLKFFILSNWYDKPEPKANKINQMYNDIAQNQVFQNANLDYDGFIQYYNLPGKI